MLSGAVSNHGVTTERRIIVLLATLAVSNPFVMYLATGHLVASLLITVTSVVVMQGALSPRLPTIAPAVLFNLFAMCSLVVHAEVILTYRFPERIPPNLYAIKEGYYFNRPFLDQSFSSSEYSVSYRTNRQGFRIAAGHDAWRGVTTADWLVIGDSFTQGAQVEFEDLSTTLLNRRFPDRIVVNAGISGLGLGEEYNYFEREGYALAPSLVILQLATFNDFMNVEPRGVPLEERLAGVSNLARFIVNGLRRSGPQELPLGRWAEPFSVDAAANIDSNIFYTQTSGKKESELDAFRRYLRAFKTSVEAKGTQLCVVLIPTREQVARPYLEEVLKAYAIDESALDMTRPNRLLAELAAADGFMFIDLLPAFQNAGGKLYFDRDEHLTPRGHAVVADGISARLESVFGRSAVEMLSRELASDRYPMMSRDGKKVVYQSYRGRSTEVFLAKPDLSDARRLTFNDVDESHPMLSSDGERVIFTEGSADTMQTEVVIASLDGSTRWVVTAEPNTFGAIPVFSRSNRFVAYAEWNYLPHSRSYSQPVIVVLDLLSGSRRQITLADVESWRPVFSPDEHSVAYISKHDGQFELYLSGLQSGTTRRLTHTAFDEWDPQFAPDGRRIVYSARPHGNWDLFVHDLTAGSTTRLTQTRGDEWDASFTPDGRAILFGGRFGLVEAIFRRAWTN